MNSNSVSLFAMNRIIVIGIFIFVEPNAPLLQKRNLQIKPERTSTFNITYNEQKDTDQEHLHRTQPIPIPKTCNLNENPYSSSRLRSTDAQRGLALRSRSLRMRSTRIL
jgi:hypothetical protein